jgi:hypothetical protein
MRVMPLIDKTMTQKVIVGDKEGFLACFDFNKF